MNTTTRTEALAQAVAWAHRAEDAETQRTDHLREGADAAKSDYLRRQAQDHYAEAAVADNGRQIAIEMAAMWTRIAAAASDPQPHTVFTVTEEPQP